MILREEMTRLQGKMCFIQFVDHNVSINCSKLLGVRKRNKAPLMRAFNRGIAHVYVHSFAAGKLSPYHVHCRRESISRRKTVPDVLQSRSRCNT